MMGEPLIFVFQQKELLVKGFSEWFVRKVSEKEGPFFVALSGGSTPKAWFEDLANAHQEDIDWTKVHLFWGDERCVPPDDEQSNYGMTKKYLLDHVPIPSGNIHRVAGEVKPELAASAYANEIQKIIPGDPLPVFDLIILGMGTDGHTASIFPDQLDLWQEQALCVVATHPDSGQRRVSFTGGLINAASDVAFLVSGAEKASKIHEILNEVDEYKKYPAAHVRPGNGDLQWFMDAEAAKQLDNVK